MGTKAAHQVETIKHSEIEFALRCNGTTHEGKPCEWATTATSEGFAEVIKHRHEKMLNPI